MFALLQDSDTVVYLGPFGFLRRCLHREFGASGVARLGHVIGRGDLLHFNGMGKAWRTQPVARLTERVGRATGRAVPFVTAIDLSDLEGACKATCATFTIEPLFLPRPEAFVGHHRIHRARGVAFPRYPNLFAGGVLRKGNRQALRWSKAHDGAETA